MGKYSFYLEFDGRKTTSGNREQPEESVHANSISQAITKFEKKNKLKSNNYEPLIGEGYRVYFESKGWRSKHKELIYFVDEEEFEKQ